MRASLSLALAIPLGLAAGCSERGPESAAALAASPAGAERRSDDPRVVAARQALDAGHLELARTLVGALGEEIGLERDLLAARVAALAGDGVESARRIESARRADPGDPRVYATAAELAAAAGHLATAEQEIQRGVAACGVTPELQRARGVHAISAPGQAEAGLALLREAAERDPGLPFLHRPLGQAWLLVAKLRMAHGDPLAALEHAGRSLEADPEDVEARRFLSDCRAAVGDPIGAAEELEALVREGEPLEGELAQAAKRAGIGALLERDRPAAVRWFLRARELGLSDDELGSGANVLADEARLALEDAASSGDAARAEELRLRALELVPGDPRARAELAASAVERALTALGAEDLEGAERELDAALARDPDSLEAHHYLGAVRYRRADYAGAAEAWSWVVDTAAIEKLELPEPVHLSLSRAQLLAGRPDEARTTLETYLALEPAGRWAGETRALLEALDAPADAAPAPQGNGER